MVWESGPIALLRMTSAVWGRRALQPTNVRPRQEQEGACRLLLLVQDSHSSGGDDEQFNWHQHITIPSFSFCPSQLLSNPSPTQTPVTGHLPLQAYLQISTSTSTSKRRAPCITSCTSCTQQPCRPIDPTTIVDVSGATSRTRA